MNFDIWFRVFLFLTIVEQAKISRTCKLFQEVYNKYISLNSLHPKKHVFYQYIGYKKYNIFSIKSYGKGKEKTEYIRFKKPSVRRKVLYDRDHKPYCRHPVKKNGFVFGWEIANVKNLSKAFCDTCREFTVCELDFPYLKCNIKNCLSNSIHYHNSCKNCYNKKNI